MSTTTSWTNITGGNTAGTNSEILSLNANTDWSGKGQSVYQQVSRGDYVQFQMVTDGSSAYWIIGLGIDPFGGESQVEYGFYKTPSGLRIYENGSTVYPSSGYISYTSSSNFKILVNTNGDVDYYVDSTLVYTSQNNYNSTSGYIHAVNYNALVQLTGQYGTNSGGGSSQGSGQTYHSAGSTPHNENRPLRIFKKQRDWF